MLKGNLKIVHSISILGTVISIMLSCWETDKNVTKPVVETDNFKNDTIYLYNKVGSDKRITFFNQGELNKYAFPIKIRDVQNARKIVSNDTLVLIEESKYTPFIVFPGERIIVKENERGNIVLEVTDNVTRNNELLFFVDLGERIKWPSAPKLKIVSERFFLNIEKTYKTAYDSSINFLNAFSQKRKISDRFYNFTKRYLYYKYLTSLFNPSIYGNTQNLHQQLRKYRNEFQRDGEVIVPTYKMAAYYYSLLLLNEKIDEETVEKHFISIEDNFQGDTRKYLLYRILINGIDKESSKPEYRKSMAFFMEKYASDTLSKILTNNYDYINNNQNILANNDYQEEGLISSEGKLISWKEMLNLYRGKVIYIDFWATWCAPCINEIPFSKKLKSMFNSTDIAFVYISCDVEKARWMNALKDLGINSADGNYLITVPDNSLIRKYFFITSVPRYMIFNKHGELIDKDALRPSDNKLQLTLLKLKEQSR